MQLPQGTVFPRRDNLWWPLPPDYTDLSVEGQKLARVNACRLQQTPTLAVYSWSYFCERYLVPWIDECDQEFNPCFYEEWKPLSAFHLQMVKWFEAYPRCGIAFPRGGAKSTTAASYILWKLITNTQWLCNAYMSKYDPLVKRLFDKIKTQIETNPRILADFGILQPKRGQGSWSSDYIRLRNFCSLAGFSIDGRLRGPRANLNLVDDIEQDPEGRLPSEAEIEVLKQKILQVLTPMLREGAHMAIIGTLLHQRAFINHLMTNTDPTSPDYDERFASVEHGGSWHKVVFGWQDSQGRNLWPEVFTETFIAQMRRELGPALFATEFENRPISTADCLFTIQPREHEYTIEEPDEHLLVEPFASTATVHWHECSGTLKLATQAMSAPWREHVSHLLRGIAIDPIRKASASSDFAVIAVGGIDSRGDLWLLDLWAGKKNNTEVCQILWDYVRRWRVPVVGVEDTGFSEEFFHQGSQLQEQFLNEYGWFPQCIPMKPPTNMSKGSRIRRLQWRYSYGKIKYPLDRASTQPWSMLYDQTLRFTDDLGNLRHDDCIDAVEMLQTLFKGRKAVVQDAPSVKSPADRWLDGERTIPGTDIPMLQVADIHTMRPDTLDRVLAQARQDRQAEADDDYTNAYEDTDLGAIYY